MRPALATTAALAALLAPASAAAQDLGFDTLVEARDQFIAGNCSGAQPLLRALMRLDVGNPREAALVTTSRKYFAACLYAQRQEVPAREILVQMLRDDPDARVDQPFDSGFVLFFAQVLHDMQAEIERIRTERVLSRRDAEARRLAREQLLRQLASTEARVDEVPRILTIVPYGGGQFANGQNALGIFFAITEGLLTATCVTTFLVHESIYPDHPQTLMGHFAADEFATAQLAYGLEWANWISVSLLAGAVVAGAIQANIAWQPARRITPVPRPLPPELQNFRLMAGPLGDGSGAGATLRLTF